MTEKKEGNKNDKEHKVVLAYSGGLDTSVILHWLINEGYQVIAFIADVGQEENFEEVKNKALKIGADKVEVVDCKEEFVTDYIFPAIQGNAIYENQYLLGTAVARPLIAKKQIEVAESEKAEFVSHGATGKGNDQVRFELSYYALNPSIKIISPWKTEKFLKQFSGRSDMLEYAKNNSIPVTATVEKSYSTDENLMHISYESGILEDPSKSPPKGLCTWTNDIDETPNKSEELTIYFKDGIPIKLKHDGNVENNPLQIFLYLNKIGAKHGVGRIDIVENRFVGIISRGVYETPGGTILYKAHQEIESIAMDREVQRLRDMLSPKFAELIYYGFWYSPEMEFLQAAIAKSQEAIDGSVKIKLYKGNIIILSRESPNSLYDQELSSMDIEGGFNQQDSEGFIKINAIRLKAHAAIMENYEK